MTKEMVILIFMEGIKCAIALWVGYLLYKITVILDRISKEDEHEEKKDGNKSA